MRLATEYGFNFLATLQRGVDGGLGWAYKRGPFVVGGSRGIAV